MKKKLCAENIAECVPMVALRKALGFPPVPYRFSAYHKAFQSNAQPALQRSCSGDWGTPQQAILQRRMQSVYHAALFAAFVKIVQYSPGSEWYSFPEMTIWQTSELPSPMVSIWLSRRYRSTSVYWLSPRAP